MLYEAEQIEFITLNNNLMNTVFVQQRTNAAFECNKINITNIRKGEVI